MRIPRLILCAAAFAAGPTASATLPFDQGMELAGAECYLLTLTTHPMQPPVQVMTLDRGQVADLRPFEHEHVAFKLQRYQQIEVYVYRHTRTQVTRTYRANSTGEDLWHTCSIVQTKDQPLQVSVDTSPFQFVPKNHALQCRLAENISWEMSTTVLTGTGYKPLRAPSAPGRPGPAQIAAELDLHGTDLPAGCDGDYPVRRHFRKTPAPRNRLRIDTLPMNFELYSVNVFPRLR